VLPPRERAIAVRRVSEVFQIVREDIRPRMRGSPVRVEVRRDGNIVVRFENKYVRIAECQPVTQTAAKTAMPATGKKKAAPVGDKVHGKSKSKWMKGFWERPAPSLGKAIKISNATN